MAPPHARAAPRTIMGTGCIHISPPMYNPSPPLTRLQVALQPAQALLLAARLGVLQLRLQPLHSAAQGLESLRPCRGAVVLSASRLTPELPATSGAVLSGQAACSVSTPADPRPQPGWPPCKCMHSDSGRVVQPGVLRGLVLRAAAPRAGPRARFDANPTARDSPHRRGPRTP